MKSSFQTILIIVFAFAFVVAIAVFSGLFSTSSSGTSNEPQGAVIIWGVLPAEQMRSYVQSFNIQGGDYSLVYEEHAPETFTQDLTQSLADGVQPDAVLVSSELFSQFKDKLAVIPYASYSERLYRDTYIDGARIFLTTDGLLAVPLLVDPLVVYYNKDLLAAANFALPPRTWTAMGQAVPLFTERDARGAITQATIALGDGQNVEHFRDILSALFLQAGNPIVAYDASGGKYNAVLNTGKTRVGSAAPTVAALDFYLSFSDPTSTAYSWNRTLLPSRDMFIAGRSAFYIGRASELFTIQAQNPNLNFDVMELFQPEESVRPLTFGSFYGLGILRSAINANGAYAFASYLSGTPEATDTLSKLLSLPPARRDLLLVKQQNPYITVFFNAALSSFSWPDPNFVRSSEVFRAMIGNVTSGRMDSDSAINEANASIQSNIR